MRAARSGGAREKAWQLAIAEDATGLVTWVWGVRKDEVRWHGNVVPLLGPDFSGRFSDYLRVVHPGDREAARRTFIECLKGIRPQYRAEERVIWPDGSVHWLETYGRGSYDKDGRCVRMAGVVRDITARKDQEVALAASEARFSIAFRSAPNALSINRAADGVFVEVNEAFERASGWTAAEAIGRTPIDLDIWIYPLERDAHAAGMARDGRVRDLRVHLRRKNGSERICDMSSENLEIGGEQFLISQTRDLTETMRAQEELQETKRLLQLIIDTSPNMIFVKDAQGKAIFVNRYLAQYYGTTPEQILAKSTEEVHTRTAEAQEFIADDLEVIRTRRKIARDELNSAPSGEQRWFHTIKVPLVRQDGTVDVLGISTDITERKRAEAKLREKEERFRSLTEFSSDWYWEQDAELRFIATGGVTDARGGITPAAHIGKRRWELSGTEILNQTWDEHRAVLAARKPFRGLLLRRTEGGEVHFVAVAGEPLFDAHGTFSGYHGVANDVTCSKLAEDALSAQTERLRIGQSVARMITMDWEIADDRISWSDSPEWLRGPLPPSGTYPVFADQVHQEDREKVLALRAKAIESLQGQDVEYRFVRTDGKVIWLQSQQTVFADAKGKATRMIIALHDISERKRAERTVRRVERMYSVLSATNEAILHARRSEDLYQLVCNAAMRRGQFITAVTVYAPDWKTGWMEVAAVAGADQQRVREARVSLDETKAEGRGLIGTAFRTLKTCVSNDFLNDERLLPWRERAREVRRLAAVAVPLLKGGQAVGVLHFCSDEVDAFDDETVVLLERMGANVSFALNTFERETERQRAEEALRESERKYRNIYESLQDVYVETTLDGTILEVSPQIEMLSRGQYKREDLLGKSTTDFYTDPKHRKALALALKERGRLTDFEFTFKNRDGSSVAASISSRILFDVNGRAKSIVSTLRDITERKHAEAELRAAEEQFRGLVEQSISGIWIIQNGRIAYANPRIAEIFGYSSNKEMVGRDVMEMVAEKDRALVAENIRKRMDGEEKSIAYTITGLRKDGAQVEIGGQGSIATFGGGPAIIGVLQDITEKARAEEEIKRYVARLEQATQSTIDVVATIGELRDPYTHGHERRVGEVAAAIAAEMGLGASRVEGIRIAGYLHDIGKIGLPAEILAKPGRLTKVEFELVKDHARQSYEILKTVEFPWPVAQAAWQHHERLNGSGYPRGLKGEDIILEARILAVADVVEAMSSHRPYRPGLGIDAALAEIEKSRGALYDPQVGDACLKLFREKNYRLPQ